MIKCPNCGGESKEDSLFCGICGTKIDNTAKFSDKVENIEVIEKSDEIKLEKNKKKKVGFVIYIVISCIVIIGLSIALVVSERTISLLGEGWTSYWSIYNDYKMKQNTSQVAGFNYIYYEDLNRSYVYNQCPVSSNITYLCFKVQLYNVPANSQLKIKITCLKDNSSKDNDKFYYTTSADNENFSTGWGNDKGNTYTSGWYLIQILSSEKIIGQQYVYIS